MGHEGRRHLKGDIVKIMLACILFFPFFIFQVINGLFMGEALEISLWCYLIIDLFGFVVIPGLCLLWCFFNYDLHASALGLSFTVKGEKADYILSCISAVIILFFLYYFIGGALDPYFVDHDIIPANEGFIQKVGQEWRWLAIFYLSLTAAFSETLVYVAVPYYLLIREGSPVTFSWAYSIIPSLLFGFVHWENGVPAVISASISGYFLLLIALMLRSAWPAVIAHFLLDVYYFG